MLFGSSKKTAISSLWWNHTKKIKIEHCIQMQISFSSFHELYYHSISTSTVCNSIRICTSYAPALRSTGSWTSTTLTVVCQTFVARAATSLRWSLKRILRGIATIFAVATVVARYSIAKALTILFGALALTAVTGDPLVEYDWPASQESTELIFQLSFRKPAAFKITIVQSVDKCAILEWLDGI